MIQLYELEANLLTKLTDADPNTILENIALIEQLESTKEKSMSIQEAQITGKRTEEDINTAREIYRRVAAEGALLYFLLI
jgi:dynein heavy chain